jgi:hypothetical protein
MNLGSGCQAIENPPHFTASEVLHSELELTVSTQCRDHPVSFWMRRRFRETQPPRREAGVHWYFLGGPLYRMVYIGTMDTEDQTDEGIRLFRQWVQVSSATSQCDLGGLKRGSPAGVVHMATVHRNGKALLLQVRPPRRPGHVRIPRCR